MKKAVFILMVSGLVLPAFTATASAKRVDRPFKGAMTGAGTIVLPPNDSPTGMWTDMAAVGDFAHLGTAVVTGRHATPPGVAAMIHGSMTLIAANGDELFCDYSGWAPFPEPDTTVMEIDTAFTITGGTGRFADASGSGTQHSWVEFKGFGVLTFAAYWVWNGTIRY